MNIGVVCYASVGGSGIVATELAKSLARRGHQVHLISTEPPFRLGDYEAGLAFHRVHTPTYPLFREPQYMLSLANKIVQLSREFSLDIVHAHYAIPHATAAYLAKQILASTKAGRTARCRRSSRRCTAPTSRCSAAIRRTPRPWRFRSISPTASRRCPTACKRDTYQSLSLKREIRVIPNFLECDEHGRRDLPELRARLCPPDRYDKLIIHLSNFRPVKRVDAVVEIFERIRKDVRAKLILRRRRSGAGPRDANGARSRSRVRRRGARRAGSGRASACRSRICSCCRRPRRVSASPRSKRWRARCRSWRRASAACRRWSRTACPDSCATPTTSRGWRRRQSRC